MKERILTRPGTYPASAHALDDSWFWMERKPDRDVLMVSGPHAAAFAGEAFHDGGLSGVCAELTHENGQALRRLFPFTAPVPVLRRRRSFGVGDRLGVAAPGHIRVFEAHPDIAPVLVQQSIRELDLTGRRYEDVLDCASFAVFREDFQGGFGADGDHLKHESEIEYALNMGFTMITLDCSEHIRADVDKLTDAEVDAACSLPKEMRNAFLGRSFVIEEGVELTLDEIALKRCQLIYGEAVEFIDRIYRTYIAPRAEGIDFEISIDETATPTLPVQHFFVAQRLQSLGVQPASLAPRFCGEFQKGVDYRGDLAAFERELKVHAALARHFGYKLSLHSGSDKFSIFTLFGKYTEGNYHVKTAGTNWLVAMRLVAEKDPVLYREVHAFALSRFKDACAYYHVTTDLNRIPALSALSDGELPALFSNDDARQLIHITYGYILTAKDEQGNFLFRDRLYRLWRREDQAYADAIFAHIQRHILLLEQGYRDMPQGVCR